MAANDKPSRIDQVFADPRWVEEALTAAAVDAIDQHRRAGVPLVVFRDGRIEHVPADRLAPDVDALLMDADFEAERTARELIAWFEERRSAINSCWMAEEPALLHKGRFKKFYEELYPFALWLGHLYAGREDVVCSLNSSASADCDYDAVVKDRATDPLKVTYVQLTTTTFDRNEFRQMEYFLTHRSTTRWGQINDAGEAEWEWLQQAERLERTFAKIEGVAQRKSKFPHGADYVLVVCFDDFMWFGTDDDRAALRSFVSERLANWHLNVATLYVVGISGRTFEPFPVPRR